MRRRNIFKALFGSIAAFACAPFLPKKPVAVQKLIGIDPAFGLDANKAVFMELTRDSEGRISSIECRQATDQELLDCMHNTLIKPSSTGSIL